VGDSRAILARFTNNNDWKTIALSIDQKPDSEGEMKRILSNGGRV
jgi:serine/threonine protein phosphatase PrpC